MEKKQTDQKDIQYRQKLIGKKANQLEGQNKDKNSPKKNRLAEKAYNIDKNPLENNKPTKKIYNIDKDPTKKNRLTRKVYNIDKDLSEKNKPTRRIRQRLIEKKTD